MFRDAVMKNGPAQGLQNVYAILFTVFHGFCNDSDYCGADRHMLKVLLENIAPVLHEALKIKDEVDTGFFLTILEAKVGKRIKKDKYDIRALRKLMTKDQKERLDI